MAPIIGGLAGIAERSAGEALAFGLGFALGRALEPAGVELAQEAWKVAPIRAVDAGQAAEAFAHGKIPENEARDWAREHGYGDGQFDALVAAARGGPALGEAFSAWRRNELTDTQFTTALERLGIEESWHHAIRTLKSERLDLGAIATAIHRGIMRGQGLIIAEPPTTDGNVPHVAPSDLDPVAEAEAHGVDAERLRILVGNTGLPPGLMEMLRLLNMGKVTEDDVKRAVAESNLRNEYMDVALELRRQLLTPHEYEEAALRGVLTNRQADAGAALHGMTPEDARTLFELLGRPLPVHQIATGLARGGTFGGSYDTVPEPYRDAIRRSSIRPEYAHLAYANRYTLPGAFVLRALAQAGDLTHAETHDLLLQTGWPPDLAAKVSDRWAGGVKGTVNKHVTSAETGLFTVLRKAYVNDEATDAQAGPILTDLGVDVPDHARIFDLWGHERALVRASLTATQIRKAVGQPGKDHAWALKRLEELGYTAADAETFLAE